MTGDGASGPWRRLAGRTGYIQADAATVFDRLYNGKVANATEVGCWAHARRKFFGLHETEPRAAKVIQLIGEMFKAERTADERRMTPEKRLELRRQRSRPVLGKLYNLLIDIAAREPPLSVLGKAAKYAINHRTALTRFLEDGRLPLTNNLDELQIQTLAIGRKNYLFAGSNAGAERPHTSTRCFEPARSTASSRSLTSATSSCDWRRAGRTVVSTSFSRRLSPSSPASS